MGDWSYEGVEVENRTYVLTGWQSKISPVGRIDDLGVMIGEHGDRFSIPDLVDLNPDGIDPKASGSGEQVAYEWPARPERNPCPE